MQNLKTCSPEDNFEFACKPKKSKICSAISLKNAVQVIFATHKCNIIKIAHDPYGIFMGRGRSRGAPLNLPKCGRVVGKADRIVSLPQLLA